MITKAASIQEKFGFTTSEIYSLANAMFGKGIKNLHKLYDFLSNTTLTRKEIIQLSFSKESFSC